MAIMVTLLVVLFCFFLPQHEVLGHGRLMDPPGRSSMWHYGFKVPQNYDDMSLNCGGVSAQYNSVNQGRCGECGDMWSLPRPRANDEGGQYGTGIVGQTYTQGQMVRMQVELTSTHKGHFQFRLCPKSSIDELVTQECLDQHPLQFHDGSTRFPVTSAGTHETFFPLVKLPDNVSCDHCVIQWTYTAGNNWGPCDPPGPAGWDCGQQETFVNCADVAIRRTGA